MDLVLRACGSISRLRFLWGFFKGKTLLFVEVASKGCYKALL